ncbi:MAG: peptidoglycan DD-metalloendopeptidase family protein [Candidatus Kapabacteria bacterium]|nr:peptidoglycan DD-metalloendopeptidase family protein [Candidatus Kapabacteria bacterium]
MNSRLAFALLLCIRDMFVPLLITAVLVSPSEAILKGKPKPAPKKPQQQPVSENDRRLAQRKTELLSLQKSIAADKKTIDGLMSKETATLQAIRQYQKHNTDIERYISLLQEEIDDLQSKVEDTRSESKELAGDLWRIRKLYAELTLSAAKRGQPSVPEMMMSRNDGKEDLVMQGVIKRMTEQSANATHTLSGKRDSLSKQTTSLLSKSDIRNALLTLKNNEQENLSRIIAAKQRALQKIRTDKSAFSTELKKKEQSQQSLLRMISAMVAKSLKTAPPVSGTTPTGGAFKVASLPSPVPGKKIVRGFGQYRNPTTNTLSNNPGLDIAAISGTAVSAVSSGTVSLVHWLPGYGSLVILDHNNGFRTVYANLSSVSVRKGQSVAAGAAVGKSGESLDGEFVHFEIWHQKQRLNPAGYLR